MTTTVFAAVAGRREPVMPARSSARFINRPKAQWGIVSCSSRARVLIRASWSCGLIFASVSFKRLIIYS